MLQLKDLKSGVVLHYKKPSGLLRMTGTDVRNFLQRMSTGDITKLTKESPVGSCFVNNKGRMVEQAYIFALGEDDVVLVTSAPQNKILLDWLLNFHFVEDLHFDADILTPCTIFISAQNQKNLPPHVVLGQAQTIDGMRIQFSLALIKPPRNTLMIDEAVWESLRIMALMPNFPQEINEDFMPDNINLAHFIGDNKGCYIGQEVIAKARTFQKQKKSLVGLRLSLEMWEKYRKEGIDPESHITSLAPLFVEGEINALAVMS